MIRIKVQKKATEVYIEGLKERLGDLRPAFIDFYAYMQRRIVLMFSRLKRGGEFRGVRWKWFAPQYRRQDGTVVPAEGMVPKVRGQGRVLGRLRHSGKRVTPRSSLMQDTGRLRNTVLNQMDVRRGTILSMDTKLDYAKYQDSLRPFQFFEDPRDVNMLRRLVQRRLES